MTYDYERFKTLWTALVLKKPNMPVADGSISNGVEPHTIDALVEVSSGNHSKFDALAGNFKSSQ